MHSVSQIEVKESRNASSLLPIKLASMISNLDVSAMVLGYVCADITLTSGDAWEEEEEEEGEVSLTLESDGVSSVGITPVFFTGRNIPIS